MVGSRAHVNVVVFLPCLASCRRYSTCEQRRSPAPDGLLTFVRPLLGHFKLGSAAGL